MMNIDTGRSIDDMAHIQQSVRNILHTRIGSRVMREAYGSLVPNIIDQPLNPVTQMQLMAAIVHALNQWEPRLRINRIDVATRNAGLSIHILAQVGDQNLRLEASR